RRTVPGRDRLGGPVRFGNRRDAESNTRRRDVERPAGCAGLAAAASLAAPGAHGLERLVHVGAGSGGASPACASPTVTLKSVTITCFCVMATWCGECKAPGARCGIRRIAHPAPRTPHPASRTPDMPNPFVYGEVVPASAF